MFIVSCGFSPCYNCIFIVSCGFGPCYNCMFVVPVPYSISVHNMPNKSQLWESIFLPLAPLHTAGPEWDAVKAWGNQNNVCQRRTLL